PVDDRRALREGLERESLRKFPLDRREGGSRLCEEGPDEPVAPVPELGLRELEELGARVHGDPGVLLEIAGVDRPVPDRLVDRGGALRVPQDLEEAKDARPADLRHEPDVWLATGIRGDEPSARAVVVIEEAGAGISCS